MDDPPVVWSERTLAGWQDSLDTFLVWTQVVGEVRPADTPVTNHWWDVPCSVTARGLTTALVPRAARGFPIDVDLVADRLDLSATAADPDAVLLAFLRRTDEAAAERAGWDRAPLRRRP